MASYSTGTSSGSTSQEAEFLTEIDRKKRKRMISNRESARRSRMKKQKHMDDLIELASQLKRDNGQILAAMNLATQSYMHVDAENSVLRTQMMELTSRLNSLNEILLEMNLNGNFNSSESHMMIHDGIFNLWSFLCMNQPKMASSHEMIQF